jgi:hypothetical protein
LGASFAEVVVEELIVPTLAEPVKVAGELAIPEVDQMIVIDFDRLDLPDHRLSDDNTSDDNRVDVGDSTLSCGPNIAQELGSKVPFFGPIAVEPSGSFFVSNARPPLILTQEIGSAHIDKRRSGGMTREIRTVEGNRERELKSRLTSHKIRLDVICSWRISVNVILDGIPHSIESFGGLFEGGIVTPQASENTVSPSKGGFG